MPQTVLIVDDSPPLHALVKVHLDADAFDFVSAYDGASALKLVDSTKPDLILLDVDLPDMNGFDVCRFLKVDAKTASIPVIFLTASSSPDEKICGLGLEAADYITKPFDPGELVARVRMALRTKRLLDLLGTTGTIATPAATTSAPAAAPPANARLSLSQLMAVRTENPWSRKPPPAAAVNPS